MTMETQKKIDRLVSNTNRIHFSCLAPGPGGAYQAVQLNLPMHVKNMKNKHPQDFYQEWIFKRQEV